MSLLHVCSTIWFSRNSFHCFHSVCSLATELMGDDKIPLKHKRWSMVTIPQSFLSPKQYTNLPSLLQICFSHDRTWQSYYIFSCRVLLYVRKIQVEYKMVHYEWTVISVKSIVTSIIWTMNIHSWCVQCATCHCIVLHNEDFSMLERLSLRSKITIYQSFSMFNGAVDVCI